MAAFQALLDIEMQKSHTTQKNFVKPVSKGYAFLIDYRAKPKTDIGLAIRVLLIMGYITANIKFCQVKFQSLNR